MKRTMLREADICCPPSCLRAAGGLDGDGRDPPLHQSHLCIFAPADLTGSKVITALLENVGLGNVLIGPWSGEI